MLHALFIDVDVEFGDVLLNLNVFACGLHLDNFGDITDSSFELALQIPRNKSAPNDLGVVKVVIHIVEHHDC